MACARTRLVVDIGEKRSSGSVTRTMWPELSPVPCFQVAEKIAASTTWQVSGPRFGLRAGPCTGGVGDRERPRSRWSRLTGARGDRRSPAQMRPGGSPQVGERLSGPVGGRVCADVIPVHLDVHMAYMPAIGAPASRTAPRRGRQREQQTRRHPREPADRTRRGGPRHPGQPRDGPRVGADLSSHRWSSRLEPCPPAPEMCAPPSPHRLHQALSGA